MVLPSFKEATIEPIPEEIDHIFGFACVLVVQWDSGAGCEPDVLTCAERYL
jgi:hypothetical protein